MTAVVKEVKEDMELCPYCDTEADVCKASLTSLKIGISEIQTLL